MLLRHHLSVWFVGGSLMLMGLGCVGKNPTSSSTAQNLLENLSPTHTGTDYNVDLSEVTTTVTSSMNTHIGFTTELNARVDRIENEFDALERSISSTIRNTNAKIKEEWDVKKVAFLSSVQQTRTAINQFASADTSLWRTLTTQINDTVTALEKNYIEMKQGIEARVR